jgi:hypothetical protein
MELSSCYVCKIKKNVNEFYKDSSRKSGIASKCKQCSDIISRERRKVKLNSNPEFRKLDNRKKEESRVNRESRDPVFKLKRKMRHSLRGSFKRKGQNKNTQSQQILGADWEIVKKHFESLFTEGMTWDNMGEWHIDHIIPLSTAKLEEEILNLCNYKNLQPLWAKDNLEKSDKIL